MTTQTTMQTSSTSWVSLEKEKYLSLTTFRRTGAAVATPVWFVQREGILYIYSDAAAGKIKRIRNNPQVQLAACTVRGKVKGPGIPGVARIVTDSQEQAWAKTALDAKYWIARRLLGLLYRATHLLQGRRPPTPILYLAVTPSPPRGR